MNRLPLLPALAFTVLLLSCDDECAPCRPGTRPSMPQDQCSACIPVGDEDANPFDARSGCSSSNTGCLCPDAGADGSTVF